MRQMILVGFLQAQNCTNLASSWRHPRSRTDSWSPDYYRDIGRVLEEGKFHLGFFDDRLSMPDMYGRNHAHTVEHGIRCYDPCLSCSTHAVGQMPMQVELVDADGTLLQTVQRNSVV